MKTVKLRVLSLFSLLLALLFGLRSLPVLHAADRTPAKRADAVLEALGAELPRTCWTNWRKKRPIRTACGTN